MTEPHPALTLATPGNRPARSAQDDQRRILTPSQVLAAGSGYIVVERPISQAANPAEALEQVLQQVNEK